VSAAEAITAQYMRRFACLGGACEDTCCHAWQIPVDRRHYQILKSAMAGSRAEREEFRANVARDSAGPAPTPDGQHARIRLGGDGACPFLTPVKLCSLQARYGERALPSVCATYPRDIARTGARWEIWGSLSCPEVARQCLLHDDAMALVDAPADATTRGAPARVLEAEPARPYERYLDDIRATAFRLLSSREHPMRTRLFLLAYLGKETSAFFHRDVAAVDEAQLAATLAHVALPETIALWDRELSAMPPPRAFTANLVAQLAQADLQAASFRDLVAHVLASFHAGGGIVTDDAGHSTVAGAALWADYADRRAVWQAAASTRLELYFENYAKNFWMREWYTTSVDLLAHARRLLVRVAVLRFLLFGHPALLAARDLTDQRARQDALDGAAVEVFYKLSRAVEHGSSFLDRIAATVVQQGMQTFAHSTFLALV
jgi:lysine-N-methylase